MSDQLYPEDVLNARPSLRQLALTAKQVADAEEKIRWDAEVEDLVADVWQFMAELGLPDAVLEDVSFEVTRYAEKRPSLEWTMDGIALRARYYAHADGDLRPIFEAKAKTNFTTSWKSFSTLEALGRIL